MPKHGSSSVLGGSAVFPTYPRGVYESQNHDDARETCLKLTQGSVSRQAYALGERILEFERTVEGQREVREVHPEVSFRAMADRHLSWERFARAKATAA